MRKKLGVLLGILLITAAFLTGCGNVPDASSGQGAGSAVQDSSAHGMLTVKMLNVGQGDAVLIQTEEQNVLIDTSDLDEQDKLRAELKKAGIARIDKVILTHPHADHIGGMPVLLKEFQVGEVYDNGMPSTSKVYLGYMKMLKQQNISRKALKAGDVLELGSGVSFRVFAPTEAAQQEGRQKGYKHDPNNESIVGKLVYGEFSMMFTGDAEKKEEAPVLAAYGGDVRAKILKSGHHGSKTSSSPEFLRAVAPEAVLISCGAGNDYGHPHKETMKKYRDLKLKIYETDKNGTITVTSDGATYDIKPEKGERQ